MTGGQLLFPVSLALSPAHVFHGLVTAELTVSEKTSSSTNNAATFFTIKY